MSREMCSKCSVNYAYQDGLCTGCVRESGGSLRGGGEPRPAPIEPQYEGPLRDHALQQVHEIGEAMRRIERGVSHLHALRAIVSDLFTTIQFNLDEDNMRFRNPTARASFQKYIGEVKGKVLALKVEYDDGA